MIEREKINVGMSYKFITLFIALFFPHSEGNVK